MAIVLQLDTSPHPRTQLSHNNIQLTLTCTTTVTVKHPSTNWVCKLTLRQLLISIHPESANIKNILTLPQISLIYVKIHGGIQLQILQWYSSVNECWFGFPPDLLFGQYPSNPLYNNFILSYPSEIKFVFWTKPQIYIHSHEHGFIQGFFLCGKRRCVQRVHAHVGGPARSS